MFTNANSYVTNKEIHTDSEIKWRDELIKDYTDFLSCFTSSILSVVIIYGYSRLQ